MKRIGLIFAACIGLVVLVQAGCYRGLAVEYPKDIIHKVLTADGWRLTVIHFEPSSPIEGALPVIMCHGATSTSYTWHLGPGYGMAPYFAERGFDVWAVNLRGRFDAEPPEGDREAARGWRFDDYLNQDLPALIDYVREATGAPQVIWIGHSMGGMLLYAYLETHGEQAVHAGVTMASPVVFRFEESPLNRWADLIMRVPAHRTIHARGLARMVAPLADQGVRFGTELVGNPDNVPEEVWERYTYNSLPNISVALLQDLATWGRQGTYFSPDGSTNYTEQLHRISVPLLIVCGNLDRLAPPEATHKAYLSVSSEDKTFRNFSRANGYAYDYGHLDIILGKAAPREVYPLVFSWVEAHQPR